MQTSGETRASLVKLSLGSLLVALVLLLNALAASPTLHELFHADASEAQHLCVNMRGVKNETSWAVTSSMLGVFHSDNRVREEVLNLVKR